MARVVAHSRNTALPFALSTAGHDVVLVDTESDVRWAEYIRFAEVIVLECEEPAVCQAFIDGISESARTADHDVRLLLLAGDATADAVVSPRSGVFVLHLPLTMARLNEALDELLAGPGLPSAAGPHGQAPPPNAPPTRPEPDRPSAEDPPATVSQSVLPNVIDVRDPISAAKGVATRRVIVPADQAPRGRRVVAPAPAVGPPRHEPPAPRTISLVRALTATLEDVASVEETATVVVAEAMNQLPSEAAAVLVRDGIAWRVAAGEGLRAREDRLTLSPQHWLVSQASSTFGIILTGGEGHWPQLYGVPLSWRKNLLALQLPPASAILVMARDEQAFSEQDLQSLIGFAEEAGQLLCDATDVRKLARLLEPFCDHPS